MDGYQTPTALGILYAEDFDRQRPPPAFVPQPATLPEPAQPPALTQADLDAACIHAVQAAAAAGSASAAVRRAEALAAIGAALSDVTSTAGQAAERIAENVARTALSMLSGLLPHFCKAHGDTEVRAVLARFVPLLAPRCRLVIRVHPGLLDLVAEDLAALDDTLLPAIELRPANLAQGDLRITWEDGSLVRDTAAICAAMHDSLAQLGLATPPPPPDHATQHRSAALAQ